MLKGKTRDPDVLLLLLYIAVCVAIVLRVSIESTGYTSPDSAYYMEAARSLRDGNKFYIHDLYASDESKAMGLIYFSAWPVGYPILIYFVSWVSQLNLFWASKVVNLLFIGLGFLLMRRINKQYSYVLASVYCAFTILEVNSYTWSEGPFALTCLYFAYLMAAVYKGDRSRKTFMLLLLTAVFMFLVRYIGVFAVGFLALAIAYFRLRRDYDSSRKLLYILFALCLFIGAYLTRNYLITGHPTGIARIHKDMESISEVAIMSAESLAGEFLLIRRYYFTGTLDLLTWLTLALQVALLSFIVRTLRKHQDFKKEFRKNVLSHSCLLAALLYLVLLIFLRSISQFDPINYRLLAPFSFLVLFAVVNYVVAIPKQGKRLHTIKVLIFCFFAVSLLLNLPKEYLLSKLLSL